MIRTKNDDVDVEMMMMMMMTVGRFGHGRRGGTGRWWIDDDEDDDDREEMVVAQPRLMAVPKGAARRPGGESRLMGGVADHGLMEGPRVWVGRELGGGSGG
jgi:hypothetical protein